MKNTERDCFIREGKQQRGWLLGLPEMIFHLDPALFLIMVTI
jgi:hypothetical protein